MERSKYENCGSVDEVRRLLRRDWARGLESIGASFDFGVLAGTSVDRLFSALDVEFRVTPPLVQTTSDLIPLRWRPRFSLEMSGARRVLEVPADHLTSHTGVMSASYLLRASADCAFRSVLPDRHVRNSVVRTEVDWQMFGEFHQFRRRLSDFGSLEAIHAADIPIQLVGGYLSKHLPSASLESYFAATPYHGYADGRIAPVISPPVRQLGVPINLLGQMQALRASGHFPFHLPQVHHLVQRARSSLDRLLVAVSRPLSDIVDAKGDPLMAINKAVVWSCGLADFQRLFSRPQYAVH